MRSSIVILILIPVFSAQVIFSQSLSNDSARTIHRLARIFPVKTKRDYKRFHKIYTDDVLFGQLIEGKDSSQIKQILPGAIPMDSNLFYLTFQIKDPDFNCALLYKNNFAYFKVKHDGWYEAQFAILFNADGKLTKF